MCKGFIKRENIIGNKKGAGEGEGSRQTQGRSDPQVKDRGKEGWAKESQDCHIVCRVSKGPAESLTEVSCQSSPRISLGVGSLGINPCHKRSLAVSSLQRCGLEHNTWSPWPNPTFVKSRGPVQGELKPVFFSELKVVFLLFLKADALTHPAGCLEDGIPSLLPSPILIELILSTTSISLAHDSCKPLSS